MSYLDRLLEGLQIEWGALGDFADYEQPTKYLVKSSNYNDKYNTPVLTAGKTFILGYTDEKEGIYKASKNPVIIFDDFTTANKWVDFDFKAKSSAMKMITSKDESKALLKYIFYWLNTLPSGLVNGDHKRQWISNYSTKQIPIPPLDVQKEIVRILDTFTELTAELTARKKQYTFYRERLLGFNEIEVEREPLGVIGEFQRGKRFVKDDMISEGVPCIHYGEMYTYYGVWANESKLFLSKELVKRKNLRIAENGDVVIVAAGETIEDIGMGTAWLGDEGVVIHDACFSFRSPLNPKYVAYFTRTKQFHDQIKKHISSGKISAINARGLEKVLIPVPSPEEQERIVTILDKFDILTNSISEGLPKEIELRNKQYEYYRDLLLTFLRIIYNRKMGQSLIEIAQTLKDADKKVQLIYAFNSSGKTRLSREFKELIAPKNLETEEEERKIKIMYYNAFTEDLFYWDNDLDYDTDRKLKIQPNSYTNWILVEQGQEPNIAKHFQHYTNDKLTPKFNEQYTNKDRNDNDVIIPAYSEVRFSFERGNVEPSEFVKISKGEESCFIWSVFYSLLEQTINVLNVVEEVDRETEQFNDLQYVFIDDPVSSLDDTHLIELAVNIAELIKSSQSDLKFIITTHNPLFYNVLFNEFNNSDSRYGYKPKHCIKRRLEKLDDGTFDLHVQSKDSPFAYHLFLLNELEKVTETGDIQKYHFNFLRNILEKTSTFLGYYEWKKLLPDEAEGAREGYYNRIINLSSHSKFSGEEVSVLTTQEKDVLKHLVKEITRIYNFKSNNNQPAIEEDVTV